jgi:hypothetical protein
MNVVIGFPPNYREIVKVFPMVRGLNMLFAYGNTIYTPHKIVMTKPLMDHEKAHGKRQSDPAKWWDLYLDDRTFRLQEEIIAHRAEYQALKDMGVIERYPNYLNDTARKLSHKVYGPMIDFETAVKEIAS